MSNLNLRQVEFINDLKIFAKDIEGLHGKAHALRKRFLEEFDYGGDNCLENCDNLETTYFFDCNNIVDAIEYGVAGFINYWTGVIVETREYGKDFRRIK